MFLISKNKITKYIDEHPESKLSLMLLLSSYNNRKYNAFWNNDLVNPSMPNGKGGSSFTNDYKIEYEINQFANAELITWVGTEAELQEKRRIEQEEIERYYREVLGQELITVSGSFTTKGNSFKQPKPNPTIPTYSSELQEKIDSFNLDFKLSDLELFTTFEEYESGIETATALFSARPGSKDFEDLLLLLFKIDHYERNDLIFPEVTITEFIIHMMKFFKLEVSDFRDILPQNEFELFVAGELKLKAYTLNRVLTRVGLNFLKRKAGKL